MSTEAADRIADETGPNPPPPPNGHAAPAPCETAGHDAANVPNARTAGAPRGNSNRTTHGLRGSKLPPGCKREEDHVQNLCRRVRHDLEAKGPLSLHAETVLQRIRRAEVTARLAARWLRLEGAKLPLAERTKLLELQNASSETIDRCLRQLKLDTDSRKSDPWASLHDDDHDNDSASPPVELAPLNAAGKAGRFSGPETARQSSEPQKVPQKSSEKLTGDSVDPATEDDPCPAS